VKDFISTADIVNCPTTCMASEDLKALICLTSKFQPKIGLE
jgi:hypothetical protein